MVSKKDDGVPSESAAGEDTVATLAAPAVIESDRDLVTRHLYGDPEAFDEVYERFGGLVFQIARRMSGDAATAEDLSQEIFLRIYKYLDRFKGKSSLKTWVYRVAINCCRSRLGRRSRRGKAFVDVEEERFDQMPGTMESTDARVVRREAREALAHALAGLPVNFREAVILRDIGDLSYEEISVVLGVRIGTVRSRIARGRNRLRTLMKSGGSSGKSSGGSQ